MHFSKIKTHRSEKLIRGSTPIELSVIMKCTWLFSSLGFPCSSAGKESVCNAGVPGLIPGWRSFPGEGMCYPLQYPWASLVAQMVKNPPAVWETWVWSLGGKIPWRRAWQHTLWYSCLENPHGRRGLAGYSPWCCKELDMTERLSTAKHSCPFTLPLRF